ncbi:MAG: CDP-diacylglycerol--glycerol-3-phosphate 3-phosphatidyltransferase [Vallitaleaceae bacterium]|jgi:CDP-diacylglycerol--glycerol-3-phosphate 3-phosphatidyltransferase|nr:CDP-diacylglycerol--glycerol-3-phosphate 3-phosphatidyltransferase [Vallitaleaceae bacterium]
MNLANKITMARMFLVPIFVAATYILPDSYAKYVAVGIFLIASLTDWLDGYLARKMNEVSNFGKYMDPLADKLLVSAALIYMVEQGLIFGWIVAIIIGREFIISGLRLVASDKGVVISASVWGKLKTIVTMVMIIEVMLEFSHPVFVVFGQILIYLALILTVISATDYIVKNLATFKD